MTPDRTNRGKLCGSPLDISGVPRTKKAIIEERLAAGETANQVADSLGWPRHFVACYATKWRKANGLSKPSTWMRGTVAERLWGKVDKSGPIPERCPELGPCHVWTGCTYREGYGFVHDHRGELGKPRRYRAHRLAWMLARGPIQDDVIVLHRCDNPRCVNVAHLEVGTQADNMRDSIEKGRHISVIGRGKKRGTVSLPDACTDRRRQKIKRKDAA